MKKFYVVLCASLVCAMNMFAQTPASDSKNVDCGSSVTITATPATGYHFVQWEDDATAPATRTISNIKDATLKNYKAIFAANQAIDPSIDDPTNPTPNPGDVLQLTPKTNDDCLVFDHWSDLTPGDADYAANPRSFTYEGVAPTFTAVFRTKVFTVTATADDNTQGSVTVTPVVP